MDRSQDGIRVSRNVSRNLSRSWRAMTAAGVASISLACGVAQPALAEWWKSQATKSPAAAVKPVQAENGFAATIRRLMAESRRAAAQGDHAKAIQLAERAAKISEASSQLLGSAGECSPQETAKFLAEARIRANQSATVAAQSKSAREPIDSKKVTPAVAFSGQGNSAPATKNLRQPQPAVVSSPTKQAKSPPATSDVAGAESPLFGNRGGCPGTAYTTSGINGSQSSTTIATDTSKAVPPSPPLPPSPAQALSGADELLAQSRLAAADGHLDQAIELAERAVAMSVPPTLFGPAQNTLDKGANQWLQSLIAQRESASKSEEPVFEPPVKISLKKRVAQVASNLDSPESHSGNPTAETVVEPQVPKPDATGAEEVITARQPEPHEALETSSSPSESSLWTEDLPPAPAPSTAAQSSTPKFSRTVITRAGEWVDVDALDVKSTNAAKENSEASAAADESEIPASSPTAATSVDATPEFPLGTVSTPGFASESANEPSQPAEQQSQGFVETTPLARVPLKNRGHIQQVANQVPVQTVPQNTSNRDPLTQLSFENESAPKSNDASAKNAQEVADQPDTALNEAPVQRFPIQRVLQLQQRLETASSLNPGGPKATDAQSGAVKGVPPKGSATVPADWFVAPESKEPIRPSEVKSEPKEATKRGILKLRGRAPIQLEETTTSSQVTSVPKDPSTVRQPVVAVSSATRWKSLADQQAANSSSQSPQLAPPVKGRVEPSGQTETGTRAEQPKLSPPVSQVAFESPETNRLSAPSANPKASQALPFPESPSIPEIAPPPPEVPGESPWYHDTAKPDKKPNQPTVVRKNAFALIDQMAETLKVPVSTLISLIGAGGLALLGVGLVVLRATIRRQYD